MNAAPQYRASTVADNRAEDVCARTCSRTREWPTMRDSDLRFRVLAHLESHNTLTLATAGPDGPWGAGLFYVNDDFLL